ncbi:RNA 2'-phosphotransferase [Allostreptomyces psammosilenae]|uniref:Probable RNA 2'-phosphotransferase n=1 Tax=Allostreptomyces psammosilenae TaxID=1892865 RepID=A0A852ZLQ0_9ACTN|nr:RNA 2'-phosphotransferase [Allostreptomyces psammosilenae]NYI03326.1 putative RNA 2'-phosphotransferase [Allostreptomyces psammosilenae]
MTGAVGGAEATEPGRGGRAGEPKRTVRVSKLLARILRHDPGSVGLRLDPAGWVEVGELLAALRAHGTRLSREELDHVVATNDKRRFAYSEDGLRIRASQGHSVAVELGYAPARPPAVLFHGTATRSLPAIWREGLLPMRRQHVHLSADRETAERVGARHGRPVVLLVDAAALTADGRPFWLSANGVWLTDRVPPHHLRPAPGDDPPRG